MLEFDKTGEAGDSGPSFVLSKLATKEAVLFDGVVYATWHKGKCKPGTLPATAGP